MGFDQPVLPLTEYGKRWILDESRFLIGAWSRQTGKSFNTTLKVNKYCKSGPAQWLYLSASERQVKQLVAYTKLHSQVWDLGVEIDETSFSAGGDASYTMLSIEYPKTGASILALPANPDTARGFPRNVFLDEFAIHKDSREIWKALYPSITRGFRIIVTSTFKGKNNKFYELYYGTPTLQRFIGSEYEYIGDRGGWSKHLITINHASEMGLELKDHEGNIVGPEELRIGYNDEDAWQEEFLCEPSDEATAFLTHDQISAIEDVGIDVRPDWLTKVIEAAEANYKLFKATKDPLITPPAQILDHVDIAGDLYLGMDIGRKKDLSVIWADVKVGGVLKALAVAELKKTPYYVQRHVLFSFMLNKTFRRACIDESGIGSNLAEDATDAFGERSEGVPFTAGNKEALALGLKESVEDQLSLVPADSVIRASLHSVKKYTTTTKHFRFDAERTDKTGHADHFWAKALAVQAASGEDGDMDWDFSTCGHSQTARMMSGY